MNLSKGSFSGKDAKIGMSTQLILACTSSL